MYSNTQRLVYTGTPRNNASEREIYESLLGVAACVAGLCVAQAHAGVVQVAVAANFAAPMARIAEAFEAASGHTLKLSSGSTGKFYAQIVAGAPFDVLLAADERTPQALIEAGHAVAGSRFTYATGRLVLWSATPGLVDARGEVLKAGGFRHLAIANPKTAPYGAAAMQVLRSLSLEQMLAPKLVTRPEHRPGLPVRRQRQRRTGFRGPVTSQRARPADAGFYVAGAAGTA